MVGWWLVRGFYSSISRDTSQSIRESPSTKEHRRTTQGLKRCSLSSAIRNDVICSIAPKVKRTCRIFDLFLSSHFFICDYFRRFGLNGERSTHWEITKEQSQHGFFKTTTWSMQPLFPSKRATHIGQLHRSHFGETLRSAIPNSDLPTCKCKDTIPEHQ